ncbi:MAG: tetratricopeptide repeat protein [Gammaproteobacteria bacterium]|nr:tetratricopeptide repeat protein [Gammaproteobacteria bacterium]
MRPIPSKARDGTDAGGYRTREVAELTGLKPSLIRRFVQHGLIQPARGRASEFRFSFQDMVLLRTAKGLLDADVTPRRTLAALLKLRDRLREEGAERPLSAMRIFADGNTVVVRDEDTIWDVETGQGHFDFEVEHLAGDVRKIATRNFAIARESDDLDSDDWYNFGLDLEEVAPEKAPEAYTRSINLNPANADAHVNLGRLYQVHGDLKHAKRHYRLALDAVPEHQLALYNLGTVFDELDELDTAVGYYQQASSIPDAHYNLARIFEVRGDELSYLRHMRRYKSLIEND